MPRFPGLSLASLKKHYDIIPLLGAVATAVVLATGMSIRTAMKNPDVSWNKSGNPEPWNRLKQGERFKFLDSGKIDYSRTEFPNGRPAMDNDTYKGI